MDELIEQQNLICKRFSAGFLQCDNGSKVGIALQTLERLPLNALRLKPEGDTCGWYIWAGEEFSNAPDFFRPLHVEHLDRYVPNLFTLPWI